MKFRFPGVRRLHTLASAVALFVFAATSLASEVVPSKADIAAGIGKTEYSPYAGRSFPTRVMWGDTHLHTAVSVDAGTMNRIGQEDAFRFARGEEITTTHGLRARLSRALDFIVVSDHAEMYGLMPQLLKGDPEIISTEKGKRWYGELRSGERDRIFTTAMEIVDFQTLEKPSLCPPASHQRHNQSN